MIKKALVQNLGPFLLGLKGGGALSYFPVLESAKTSMEPIHQVL
jgi:hypothetical protein